MLNGIGGRRGERKRGDDERKRSHAQPIREFGATAVIHVAQFDEVVRILRCLKRDVAVAAQANAIVVVGKLPAFCVEDAQHGIKA